MVDNKTSALLQEHALLHDKMNQSINHIVKIEIYLVIAIGLLYSWYFTFEDFSESSKKEYLILVIPIIFSVVAFFRHRMQVEYMTKLAAYMKLVEESLFVDNSISGWENEYPKELERRNKVFRGIFWISVFVITGFAALLLPLL